MALLLDDLLDIARITQGKLQLKKETLSLIPVVDAAVEAVRPTLEGKNQQLNLSLPSETVLLDADHLRLSQIISNLLTNAVKYSDPGSHIELACAVQGATLPLSVKDDGIGIAPESLGSVFEMFSQVDGVGGEASRADSASAWRWSRASPSCTAARSRHAAPGWVTAASSSCACRWRRNRRALRRWPRRHPQASVRAPPDTARR